MALKMANYRPVSLALLLLLFLAVGCTAPGLPMETTARSPLSPLAAPPPGPLTLTIVHSNDSWGYLDPCG